MLSDTHTGTARGTCLIILFQGAYTVSFIVKKKPFIKLVTLQLLWNKRMLFQGLKFEVLHSCVTQGVSRKFKA